MAFVPSSGLKLDNGITLSEALQALATNKEEMSRMLQSLKFYESENKRLIDELFAANKIQQTNTVKIAEFEKLRQSLQKKLLTGEKVLKYEKVASEGLSKKVAMLGQELVEEKESKKNLFDETLIGRKRIIELEKSLSSGRSLRLKEMHENELFKRQISGLEARMIDSEEDNRRAQTDLLAKIQQLETAVALNQAQGRTIAAQNEEMVALAREVCALREKQRVLLDRTRRIEHVAAVCARERDAFEREVQRLRHPMLKGAPPSSQSLQLQLGNTGVGAELEHEMRMFQQTEQHDWDGTVEPNGHAVSARSSKPKQLATSAYRGAHALTRPRIEGRGQTQGVIGSGQGNNNGPSLYTSSVLSNTSKHLLAEPYTGTTAMDSRHDRMAPQESLGQRPLSPFSAKISNQTVARLAAASSNNNNDDSMHVFLQDSVHRSLSAEATPHRLSKALAYVSEGKGLSYSASYLQNPSKYIPVTVAPISDHGDRGRDSENVSVAMLGDDPPRKHSIAIIPRNEHAEKGVGHGSNSHPTKKKISTTEGLVQKPKSMFTGRGLGLRNDPNGLDRFQPQGSAKQILKKILAEFED